MTLCRYGGVVEREAVVAGADWFVNDWADLEKALKRYKVWSVFTRLLSHITWWQSCTCCNLVTMLQPSSIPLVIIR